MNTLNNFLFSQIPRILRRSTLISLTVLLIGYVNGPAAAQDPVMLILGDSISAEYGLPRSSGWVALMDKRMKSEGYAYRVINASISGETTSGGRSRIKRLLTKHSPKIVIVELGGNDALRGLDLKNTEENLSHITRASIDVGAKVLLLGMQVPPNYGQAYTEKFTGLFSTIAKQYNTALVPFLLAPIAEDDNAFQPDGIHPTQQAQPRLMAHMWEKLAPILVRH